VELLEQLTSGPKALDTEPETDPTTSFLTKIGGNGIDLPRIHGVIYLLAIAIICLIITDMNRWHPRKHFQSWRWQCSNYKIIGRKSLSSVTRRVQA
jgi:hypothetical protein